MRRRSNQPTGRPAAIARPAEERGRVGDGEVVRRLRPLVDQLELPELARRYLHDGGWRSCSG